MPNSIFHCQKYVRKALCCRVHFIATYARWAPNANYCFKFNLPAEDIERSAAIVVQPYTLLFYLRFHLRFLRFTSSPSFWQKSTGKMFFFSPMAYSKWFCVPNFSQMCAISVAVVCCCSPRESCTQIRIVWIRVFVLGANKRRIRKWLVRSRERLCAWNYYYCMT